VNSPQGFSIFNSCGCDGRGNNQTAHLATWRGVKQPWFLLVDKATHTTGIKQYMMAEGQYAPRTFKSLISQQLVPTICAECDISMQDWCSWKRLSSV
jgi:hypothetical protein